MAVQTTNMSKVLLPFRLKAYDKDMKEIVSPPIWLEFDEPANEGGWDRMAKVEIEAKAILLADLECSVDWDTLISQDAQPGTRTVPN